MSLQPQRESEDGLLLVSESDELGTTGPNRLWSTGQSRRWSSVAAVGALMAMVLCATVSVTPPLKSPWGGEGLNHLTTLANGRAHLSQTDFSATDHAAKKSTDNSLGFPIYSFGTFTKRSAKQWIIELGGDEQDVARNKNKIAETFGDKVVYKGITMPMVVVKGTLADLKLGLKGYKPGEIKFAEQDGKMKAMSSPNDKPPSPEPLASRGEQEIPPSWGLDSIDQRGGIDQRNLPTDEGFHSEADLENGKGDVGLP